MASDKPKGLADIIFTMFGGVYRSTITELVNRGPDTMYAAFAVLINEARKRSGLTRVQSLAMIKVLKKVLDRVIEEEGG